MIGEQNKNIAKVQFPWAEDYWTKAALNPWHAAEVPLNGDIADWKALPEQDKKIIAGLLRGFTIIEGNIRDYWQDLAFLADDVHLANMCIAYANQETIHQHAYSYLEQSLGLDTYEAFVQDETAQAKLAHFAYSNDTAKNLALFSGAGECVSLFASFLLLMSYCKEGKFSGLRQILSWSIRDESVHAESAACIFKTYIESNEKPAIAWLKGSLESARQNELAFIANAFNGANKVAGLALQDIDAFIKYRCNLACSLLGYDTIYEDAQNQEWFDLLTGKGNTTHSDFFSGGRNGSGYTAKLSQDFKQGLLDFVSSKSAPACDLSGFCY